MSKRKRATASKHARSPKIAARAQRAKQAIVRSPKDNPPRQVAAGSTESSPELHNYSTREPLLLVENPSIALHDDFARMMKDNDSKKGFDSSSAITSAQAYEAKILEMAQANVQFAFEFAQKLLAIRSPFEIFSVMAEFTSKRIAMFGKYSGELSSTRW